MICRINLHAWNMNLFNKLVLEAHWLLQVLIKSKLAILFLHYVNENSLDAGIQDSSTSISIVVKFEERCEDGDESDKHI